MSGPAQRLNDYYEQTVTDYADLHVQAGDEHFIALEYVLGLMSVVRADSVLDVGAGTGRAVRFLRGRQQGLRCVGLEPSDALRAEAIRLGGEYVAGGGESLPFEDNSFDVVLATGVLHHVENPGPVVAEMMRVASKGVFISDSNRFGQGGRSRLAKPLVHRAGLWPVLERLRTRGRGYMESDTDGIFYSYSVYDSLPAISDWADRAFVIPTARLRGRTMGATPYLNSTHALLVGIREPLDDWAGR